MFQKRGLCSFPMISIGGPGYLVPVNPAAPMPELLKSDDQPAAENVLEEVEAGPTPMKEVPPAAVEAPMTAEIDKKDTSPEADVHSRTMG